MRVGLFGLDGAFVAEIEIPSAVLPIVAVLFNDRVFLWHGRHEHELPLYDEARLFIVAAAGV